jgi:hypothetical protein
MFPWRAMFSRLPIVSRTAPLILNISKEALADVLRLTKLIRREVAGWPHVIGMASHTRLRGRRWLRIVLL